MAERSISKTKDSHRHRLIKTETQCHSALATKNTKLVCRKNYDALTQKAEAVFSILRGSQVEIPKTPDQTEPIFERAIKF